MRRKVFFKLWILHFKNMGEVLGILPNFGSYFLFSVNFLLMKYLTIQVFIKYAWSKDPVRCSIVISKYFILNGPTWTRSLLFKLQLCSSQVLFVCLFLHGTFFLYIIFNKCVNIKHRDCFTTVTPLHCVPDLMLRTLFCFLWSCSLPNLTNYLPVLTSNAF